METGQGLSGVARLLNLHSDPTPKQLFVNETQDPESPRLTEQQRKAENARLPVRQSQSQMSNKLLFTAVTSSSCLF